MSGLNHVIPGVCHSGGQVFSGFESGLCQVEEEGGGEGMAGWRRRVGRVERPPPGWVG